MRREAHRVRDDCLPNAIRCGDVRRHKISDVGGDVAVPARKRQEQATPFACHFAERLSVGHGWLVSTTAGRRPIDWQAAGEYAAITSTFGRTTTGADADIPEL